MDQKSCKTIVTCRLCPKMVIKFWLADLVINQQLLGESILTRYNNRSYIIDDINFEMSPKSTFTNEKGVQMTFIDYYKKQYGLEVKDKDQPLLINR